MHPATCRAVFSLVAVLLSTAVYAQSAFDPEPMAYVFCITNETKRLALVNPPVAKDTIVEQSFRACALDEEQVVRSLADKGLSAGAIEERLGTIQKFIRQTAPDDIERFRINRVPR